MREVQRNSANYLPDLLPFLPSSHHCFGPVLTWVLVHLVLLQWPPLHLEGHQLYLEDFLRHGGFGSTPQSF